MSYDDGWTEEDQRAWESPPLDVNPLDTTDKLRQQAQSSNPEWFTCEEPGCTFATHSSSGLKRHQTRTHGAAPSGHGGGASDPNASEAPREDGTEPPPPIVDETVPTPPSVARGRSGLAGSLRDRVRARFKRGGPAEPARAAAKRPAPRGKRIPLAGDFEGAYRGLGRRLEGTPHYPAGRMLTYQAPGAGVILDRAVANTVLDRVVLQPMWRSKDKWEDLLYLTGPPVLLIMIQSARMRQQATAEAGDMDGARKLDVWIKGEAEAVAWMIRGSMLRLAPAMAEARRRAEEEADTIREAFPDLPPEVDPVEAVMSMLFAPPMSMEDVEDVGAPV